MPDVVIIGAGAAGLAAFQKLRQASCDALLLEARERVGGRLWTLQPGAWPAPVELGAEFMHCEIPGLEAAASREVNAGADWTEREGKLLPSSEMSDGAEAVLERLPQVKRRDMSFATFLRECCKNLPLSARAGAVAFIEGYEAADVSRVSVLSLQREFAANRQGIGWPQRPRGGYARLLE